MEFVPQLLTSLWSLKSMYDQHGDNKNEIARLQKFIEDYEERIPQLLVGFKQHGVSGTSLDDLKKLRVVIMEATDKLNRWSADSSFFRVFSSNERMQKLDRLEADVMASTQKAVGFVTLALVMQLNSGHQEILARVNQLLERLPESRQSNAGYKDILAGVNQILERLPEPMSHQAHPEQPRTNQANPFLPGSLDDRSLSDMKPEATGFGFSSGSTATRSLSNVKPKATGFGIPFGNNAKASTSNEKPKATGFGIPFGNNAKASTSNEKPKATGFGIPFGNNAKASTSNEKPKEDLHLFLSLLNKSKLDINSQATGFGIPFGNNAKASTSNEKPKATGFGYR